VRLELPPFTLVGATTRAGRVARPLRERFGIPLRLDFYDVAELAEIVARAAALIEARVTAEAVVEIARRSRGTPRIAGRLLRRVRDFTAVAQRTPIDAAAAAAALDRLEVDPMGLDAMDRRYLRLLAESYGGGPVGVDTMAAALAEQRDVLEEVIEPYLVQQGLLQRSPRGRLLTAAGCRLVGLRPPAPAPCRDAALVDA
jgi:Holliday junction DNA helicase RuvB